MWRHGTGELLTNSYFVVGKPSKSFIKSIRDEAFPRSKGTRPTLLGVVEGPSKDLGSPSHSKFGF